jgi:hypothetical protein
MKLPFRKEKKKKSVLEERLERLRREHAALSGELQLLGQGSSEPTSPRIPKPPTRYHRRQEPPPGPDLPIGPDGEILKPRQPYERSPEEIKEMYEKRFADYLASSFQPVPPLRHERRIQRNRALFMLGLVILALILLNKLLFL